MTAKKRRIILSAVVIVEILGLIGLGIYAWIEGGMSPQLTASQVKIVNSPGITMLLNGDPTNTININDFINDHEGGFSLAEASSPDGRQLFIRDDTFNPTDDDTIIFVRDAESYDQGTTYISFNFTMRADFDSNEAGTTGATRAVWLDPTKCFIRDADGEAIIPIRISVTYSVDGGELHTVILGEDWPEGTRPATNPVIGYYPGTYDNHYYHEAMTNNTVQNVESFSTYAPGLNTELFSLGEGVEATMTINIWLEGADPLCVDEPEIGPMIAGGVFDLSLYFTTISE